MSKSAVAVLLGIILFFFIPPLGLLVIFFGILGLLINSLRKKPEKKDEKAVMVERIYLSR